MSYTLDEIEDYLDSMALAIDALIDYVRETLPPETQTGLLEQLRQVGWISEEYDQA